MKNTKSKYTFIISIAVDSYKDLHANVKNEYDNRDRSPLTQIPSTITSFMEKARPKNKFDFCNVQEKENYDMMNCNSVSTNSKSNLKYKTYNYTVVQKIRYYVAKRISLKIMLI